MVSAGPRLLYYQFVSGFGHIVLGMEKEVIGVKGVAGHWHMSFDGIFIESPMTKILSTTRILRVGFFYINLRRLRLDTVLLDTCPFH